MLPNETKKVEPPELRWDLTQSEAGAEPAGSVNSRIPDLVFQIPYPQYIRDIAQRQRNSRTHNKKYCQPLAGRYHAGLAAAQGRARNLLKGQIMRIAVCFLVVIMSMVLCSTVYGQGTWSLQPGIGDGFAFTRTGYTPDATPRVTVGFEGLFVNDLEDKGQGYGPGFFGRYDLVQDADFELLGLKAPVTWYVGVYGDVLFRESWKSIKPLPGLMTGLYFGKGTLTADDLSAGKRWAASFGVEEQYLATSDLWAKFADVDRTFQTVVFVQIAHR